MVLVLHSREDRTHVKQHRQRQNAHHHAQGHANRNLEDIDQAHPGANEHQKDCQPIVQKMKLVGYSNQKKLHGAQAQNSENVTE